MDKDFKEMMVFVTGITALVLVVVFSIWGFNAYGPCVEGRTRDGECSNRGHRLEVTPGATLCRCPHTLGTSAVSSATP